MFRVQGFTNSQQILNPTKHQQRLEVYGDGLDGPFGIFWKCFWHHALAMSAYWRCVVMVWARVCSRCTSSLSWASTGHVCVLEVRWDGLDWP